jgi:hypothetical protein
VQGPSLFGQVSETQNYFFGKMYNEIRKERKKELKKERKN